MMKVFCFLFATIKHLLARLMTMLALFSSAFSAGLGYSKESLNKSNNQNDAPAVIRSVIAVDQGGWGKLFAERPTLLMRRYFSPAFNVAWANAMRHNGDEPVLDGDPITGWQGVQAIALKSMEPAKVIDSTTVTIVAHLSVRAEGKTQPESVTFTLKRENNLMRIEDITSQNMPSLRTYFRQSYEK